MACKLSPEGVLEETLSTLKQQMLTRNNICPKVQKVISFILKYEQMFIQDLGSHKRMATYKLTKI